jgi:hypothetical protein
VPSSLLGRLAPQVVDHDIDVGSRLGQPIGNDSRIAVEGNGSVLARWCIEGRDDGCVHDLRSW